MKEMTSRERIGRMYDHREADRVPVTDGPWPATVARWKREGMPDGVSIEDFFGLDHVGGLGADITPRYPERVIAEDEQTITKTTAWGATIRDMKNSGSVPEFLEFKVVDPASWAEARKRMTPSRDRVNWDWLKTTYAKLRADGAWIMAGFWFGFDVTHAWTVGTERLLTAMATDPEWVMDMFNHYLDMCIAHFDMMWDEGYRFDEIIWPDDMGYKHSQFFSLDMYRELLKPVHKRACDWAHAKNLKVHLHSCGYVEPFIPDLLEIGVDMLNPIEVKAGMDPLKLKGKYGDRLAFHGGLNALLYEHPEKMWEEMRRVIPGMKKNGGYWIGSDHSVPDSVSLETFREFVRLAKELGSYA